MVPSPPAKGRSLQADTLAASVVLLLVATIVQRSVGFGRGVLFCRWLSPEALGEWELAYSFLMLAAPLAVLGVPGSFGRYAEHFRRRGYLKTFLNRTAAWTIASSLGAIGVLEAFAPQISTLVFGTTAHAALMRAIGVCLVAVIFQHTLTSLLAALRLYRIVTALNFAQSIIFAAVSLALMWRWPTMLSIVIGYATAALVASIGALVWSWPALHGIPGPDDRLPHSAFWPKLLRFAFFVWVTNVLLNLFGVIDRYMLVHCAGFTAAEALDQVGHYHSSRVIPLLLASVAELLAALVMPHLSHDWESGQREAASAKLRLTVKLTSLGMLAAGLCILAVAPLLFNVVLEGRYGDGLAVLPWTLAGCVWYAIYCVAQNYLWCAERTRLATIPLAIGLAVNILLNFAFLPSFGLFGAVLSVAISTAVVLATVLLFSRVHGMPVDAGTWILALAPGALGFGYWPGMVAGVLVTAAALGGELVFTHDERQQIKDSVAALLRTATTFVMRTPAVTTNT